MFKIQCDKNLINVAKEVFSSLCIEADISVFSEEITDISIMRSQEKVNTKANYLIINADDKALINSISNTVGKVITCGLSSRSTVTFSSVLESEGVMCVQRSIVRLDGKKIPPFELPFKYYGKVFDEVSILMIITAALLCGVDVSKLNKIYL